MFILNISVQFYHIKNLQSTKTSDIVKIASIGFITLRIYKVLKLVVMFIKPLLVLSH